MKKFLIVATIVIVAIICFIAIVFYSQYSSNGYSHYLNIEISECGEKEIYRNQNIMIKTNNLDVCNVINWKSKEISLKRALEEEKVDIKNLCKYANVVKQLDGNVVYIFENYQIEVSDEVYIISPVIQ